MTQAESTSGGSSTAHAHPEEDCRGPNRGISMTAILQADQPVQWSGCYDDHWDGLIVDDAVAHPAKFSAGLIRRIFGHGYAEGFWKHDDLIGDPFAGVACGGIIASGVGLRWIGVELEERFVVLANENIRKWRHIGPSPIIIQGDSREFAKIVGECDAIVTSPPFADQFAQTGGGIYARGEHTNTKAGNVMDYGQTPGQIGNESNTTYWQAMRQVYEQCWLALKPGGVMAVVIKDYVKKGRRVPLCDDTWTLLQSCGFEPIERIRAMLVKEQVLPGLFGEVVERKERKSFFRRLAEKNGSPPIDWEEVLFVRRRLSA